MDVPFNAAAAARAAIVLAASRPWRLVELGLVDFPYAARAPQEGERYRAAYRQQIVGPDLGHSPPRARLAGVAPAGAAKASLGKWPLAPAGVICLDDAGCVAARAVDVRLKAVPADVAYCLEWKRAKHACDVERYRSRIISLH
jgi:hypothetical protein